MLIEGSWMKKRPLGDETIDVCGCEAMSCFVNKEKNFELNPIENR